jgi:hypothetical protein
VSRWRALRHGYNPIEIDLPWRSITQNTGLERTRILSVRSSTSSEAEAVVRIRPTHQMGLAMTFVTLILIDQWPSHIRLSTKFAACILYAKSPVREMVHQHSGMRLHAGPCLKPMDKLWERAGTPPSMMNSSVPLGRSFDSIVRRCSHRGIGRGSASSTHSMLGHTGIAHAGGCHLLCTSYLHIVGVYGVLLGHIKRPHVAP